MDGGVMWCGGGRGGGAAGVDDFTAHLCELAREAFGGSAAPSPAEPSVSDVTSPDRSTPGSTPEQSDLLGVVVGWAGAVSQFQQIMMQNSGNYQQQPSQQQQQQNWPQRHPSGSGWRDRYGDVPMRREMIRRIALLQVRKPNAPQDWLQKLLDMARRLEDSLYHFADCREDYENVDTLMSRQRQAGVKMGARQNSRQGAAGGSAGAAQQGRYAQQGGGAPDDAAMDEAFMDETFSGAEFGRGREGAVGGGTDGVGSGKVNDGKGKEEGEEWEEGTTEMEALCAFAKIVGYKGDMDGVTQDVGGRIVEIRWKEKSLGGTLPVGDWLMPWLRVLDLSGNNDLKGEHERAHFTP